MILFALLHFALLIAVIVVGDYYRHTPESAKKEREIERILKTLAKH